MQNRSRIKTKIVFVLITVLFFAGCHPRAKSGGNSGEVIFEEYFPLDSGLERKFNVNYGSIVNEQDSYMLKSALIRGREIYYIVENSDDAIIGINSFCQGVFYFERGNFYYSPIFWKQDIEKINLDYFEILFPKQVRFDSVYKYKDGEKMMKYKFQGFESILIEHKTFSDCLKLTITENWPSEQYRDTVWFQKNFGVVKWRRGTGRLEEIKP